MSEVLLKARALACRLAVSMMKILVRPRRPVFYRLAILKLDRIGDALLSLGAVRKLLSVFREDETLLIVSSMAAPPPLPHGVSSSKTVVAAGFL
jgi:hypothetical protein